MSGFTLVLNPGQSDYADCAGEYKITSATVRGKPLWFNTPKSRFIFYNGQAWAITNQKFLVVICEGATGAFYTTQDGPDGVIDAAWAPRYRVEPAYSVEPA